MMIETHATAQHSVLPHSSEQNIAKPVRNYHETRPVGGRPYNEKAGTLVIKKVIENPKTAPVSDQAIHHRRKAAANSAN